MKLKSFAAFAGLTLAALIAAIFAAQDRDAGPPAASGQPLIPGLAQKINQVTVVVVSTANQSLTLTRSDPESDRWTIVEKFGYPADPGQIRRVVVALAGAKAIEPRTADPGQYSKLALGDDSATTITLRSADGTELPALAIGKTVSGATPDHPGSFYARRTAEPQTWLAEGRLPPLTADPAQWLPGDLPSLPRDRIASVTIARPGAEPITIARKEPGVADFTASGLPKTGKARQAKLNDLAGADEFLGFEDVAPAEPDTGNASVTTIFKSFDGEVLAVRVQLRDGNAWASFAASLETASPSPEASQRIKEFQSRYGGWSYRLSDAAAKELAPAPDELVEPAKTDDGPAKRK